MFDLSVAAELFQGSTERTWNYVSHLVRLLWTKLYHIRQSTMPRSRKRHHSRSRSRSRSHSRDRSRDDKHRKNDSFEKDREGKRRKIESYDSPHHKRSVSSEPECPIDEKISAEDIPVQPDKNIITTKDVDCNKVDNLADECEVEDEENAESKIEKDEKKNHENVPSEDTEVQSHHTQNADYIKVYNSVDEHEVKNEEGAVNAESNMEKGETNHENVSLEDNEVQSHRTDTKENDFVKVDNLANEHEAENEDGAVNTESEPEKDEKESNHENVLSENTHESETEYVECEVNAEVETEKRENRKNPDVLVVLNDSDDKIESTNEDYLSSKKQKFDVTPKKVLSPKQLQKRLDSEKKRKEKQKEKEEIERKKNEERERIRQEKVKKKEEKQKKLEQKLKEKELKEEQKRKEKQEKEQKRKDKEEREEQKRKEREQEKLKKQQEIEEKNKEKQKEEEKKQKAAAAFVNFFVPKKNENPQEDKKIEETRYSAFMAFEVKSDMKLPPLRRQPLSEIEIKNVDLCFEKQDVTASYLNDLKSGKPIGKSYKTWPFEEQIEDDVAIVEDERNLGETICEDASKQVKIRAKFLKFHENRRPPYFGTWRKKSKFIAPRRPFAEDNERFNYEEDSDDDWEEEEQGESLTGSDEEAEKENEDEKDDYEVDNEFFVPHGHLSDDEIDDEMTAKLSPESLKQKLKLLKDKFDQDMQSKTCRLKSRAIGCIWYNKDGSNVEEAIDKYLQPFAMITNGQIQVEKRKNVMNLTPISRKHKPMKELNPEYIPIFLKIIHGNSNKKGVLVEQFLTYMNNNGITVDISKTTLIKKLKNVATWRKCNKNGPLKNKFCWCVNEDVEKKYCADFGQQINSESDTKNCTC